jgi:hypothetical protein
MTKRTLPVGVYGPRRRGGQYYASISYWTPQGKVQKHLGTFATIEEAAEARRAAEQRKAQ